MIADVITIGDELLTGERTDTNGPWIGRYLANQNVEVRQINTLGDHRPSIKQALRAAMNEVDLVILTGGLGPTHDDVTKEALQDLFQKPLTRHEPTLSHIQEKFKQRGLTFTESNYRQADVLSNCDVLFNKQGTAPGMWFEEQGVGLAVLPGVPHEMKYLVREEVQSKIERLESWKERRPVIIHYIQTAGVGESTLSDKYLDELKQYEHEHLRTAYLPNPGGVTLRINSYGPDKEQAQKNLKPIVEHIRQRLKDHIFHEGDEQSMERVLGDLLKENTTTIAAAESCTGGLLMDTLTNVPGSSNYFEGGVVAYSNQAKQDLLGVAEHTLKNNGAVSKPVALQMAKAAAKHYRTDIGISTTGIAGPGGGTDDKPVGTVWIGFYSEEHHFAIHTVLTKERFVNKQKSVAIAMDLVRRKLINSNTYPYDLTPAYATE